jgi:ubiquinone/menaquinone biosynthesis C-methylase UbiE
LIQKPEKILDGLVKPGQTVADIGCGPGFFTLPMAKMVSEKGKVIAADLQQEMLDKLHARAAEKGLKNTIHYHLCGENHLGITEKADFILAFYMVHEVPDADIFFRETRGLINPGGRLLYVEPKFHVNKKDFQEMIKKAENAGWTGCGFPKILLSRAALLN